MSGTILRCFLDSDLRSGHRGLTAQAKKEGINVRDLRVGEYVVFVNTKRDRVKVYAPNETIAYMKSPKGVPVDLRVIREIPRAFTGNRISSYDKALENVLTQRVKELPSPLTTAKRYKERVTNAAT